MDKETFNHHFGLTLKQIRNKEGLTQHELSLRTGVQRVFISDLERGDKGASVHKLFQLCDGIPSLTADKVIGSLTKNLEKHER